MFKLPDAISNIAAEIGACVSGSVMLEAMGHKLPSGEPFRATKYSLFVDHTTDLTGLFDAELEEDVDEYDFESAYITCENVFRGTVDGHKVSVYLVNVPDGATLEETMDEIVREFDVPCISGYFDRAGNMRVTLAMRNAIATSNFYVDEIRLHRLLMYRARGFTVTHGKLDGCLTITEDTRHAIIGYLATHKPRLVRCIIKCQLKTDDLRVLRCVETLNFHNHRPDVEIINHPNVEMFGVDVGTLRFGPKVKNVNLAGCKGTIYIPARAVCEIHRDDELIKIVE